MNVTCLALQMCDRGLRFIMCDTTHIHVFAVQSIVSQLAIKEGRGEGEGGRDAPISE